VSAPTALLGAGCLVEHGVADPDGDGAPLGVGGVVEGLLLGFGQRDADVLLPAVAVGEPGSPGSGVHVADSSGYVNLAEPLDMAGVSGIVVAMETGHENKPQELAAPRISWFVWSGGEKLRRTATMRGWWPGYDAECSCGWATNTGGAIRAYIQREVWFHKHIDHEEPIA
jgi:hypothetical protein